MKLFSFTFLGVSALLFARTAAHGHFLQAAFLATAAAIGVHFLIESFRSPEATAGDEALDFEEGDELVRSPLAKTAAEQNGQEPVLVLVEMPALDGTRSELHAFGEATRCYRDGKRTLVIGQFHQGRGVTNTLSNHLARRRPFGDIVCREISGNVDLIPYTGAVGLEQADQANLFIIARRREYERIVLLLPAFQLTLWRDILMSGYPSVETGSRANAASRAQV